MESHCVASEDTVHISVGVHVVAVVNVHGMPGPVHGSRVVADVTDIAMAYRRGSSRGRSNWNELRTI
jgi:hypothetical protein